MAITTPDAVPGEVIEAAWGDAVRADLTSLDSTRVKKAGDTMTGHLSGITPTSAAHLSRKDYVDQRDDLRVSVAGDVLTGNHRWGPADPTAGTGLMIRGDAALISCYFGDDSAHVVSSANMSLNRAKTPVSDVGGIYLAFRRSGGTVASATTIGSVTVATGGAGVNYNASSDKRLKTLTRPVDPDEALAKVTALEPVNFTWTEAPEAGELVGFFAQDTYPIAPEAVTPGYGDPSDDEFIPWGMDPSKLIPTLVAAIQALTTRITALEEAATP